MEGVAARPKTRFLQCLTTPKVIQPTSSISNNSSGMFAWSNQGQTPALHALNKWLRREALIMHLLPIDRGQTSLTRPNPGGLLLKVCTRGLNKPPMATVRSSWKSITICQDSKLLQSTSEQQQQHCRTVQLLSISRLAILSCKLNSSLRLSHHPLPHPPSPTPPPPRGGALNTAQRHVFSCVTSIKLKNSSTTS